MLKLAAFVVRGRPFSVRASAASRNRWREEIGLVARDVFSEPLQDNDLRIQITFFFDRAPSFDIDNISKPICDALNGIAYNDDEQLVERNARRKDIGGSYSLEDVEPELVAALADLQKFVCIELFKVGEEITQL